MNQKGENYRFIVTGGPGSGKTSLINALSDKGYKVFPEIAAKLMESGVKAPVSKPEPKIGRAFAAAVLKERIRYYTEADKSNLNFYDRGIPDSLGFLNYLGQDVPEGLKRSISKYPYNNNAFILPPWKEIYVQDNIRMEDFEIAVKIYNSIRLIYLEYGYKLWTVPKIPVEERVGFVLQTISGLFLLSHKPVGQTP